MNIKYNSNCDNISWQELSKLYQATDFGFKSPERLKKVFTYSQYVSFAYLDNVLVGASRAFSDNTDCAVVCDMTVFPELQGKGIGSQLLSNLLYDIGDKYHRIMLYATLGKEHFYKKHGFGLMTSAMCIFKDQKAAIKSGYIKNI